MEIEALLKTMMDELKDAQMMYDYACGSKKYGHDDLMTFYITRAEQRLKMFDEDHAIILREIGKKENYKWAFPLRWFDMQNDEAVLIGNEFWELIGGEGTYKSFINQVNKLGKEYKEQIYREFLEIEPPINQIEDLLK